MTMIIKMKQYIFAFFAVAVILSACRDDKWNEHNKLSDETVSGNILAAIQGHPEGSMFYQAAVTAGYDELLTQANNFTVFVPDNNAWQGVNMNDEAEMKRIVSNHIAYGKYLKSQPELYAPLKMVNDKNIRYDETTQTFSGAKVTNYDNVAGNGVFHVTDRLLERRDNIWEYISTRTELEQVEYIASLTHKEMDIERSVQTGVNAFGQAVYDTIWHSVNNFLRTVPLNNEDTTMTYILLKNEGFNRLYSKYRKYLIGRNDAASDSLTRFNVCQDFIFRGIVDITGKTELVNAFDTNVPLPLNGAEIEGPYELSNGRVYIVNQSDIQLRDKFKPVHIEGEDYSRSAGNSVVYVRYKRWASGERDVMLSCSNTHRDTVFVLNDDGERIPSIVPPYNDSIEVFSSTYQWDSNNRANINNFWIEYKAPVYALDYEIHYVACNDIVEHSSNSERACKFDQKLFISLPGKPALRKDGDMILNNYLEDICFVSRDTAYVPAQGVIPKPKKMMQWRFDNTTATQFITEPVEAEAEPNILKIEQAGELTLWLCNTTWRNDQNAQGILFLDYIKLVPIFKEDEN